MPAPATEWITAARLALGLEWRGTELSGLDLQWADGRAPTPNPSPLAAQLAKALDRYVQGEEPRWPAPPFAWSRLSPFAAAVLRTLHRDVGFGRIVTYGQLASLADHPNAARAVGRVMAMNPWPLIVPCHRVLGAGGRLHGFSGQGLTMKHYLLSLEGLTRPAWDKEIGKE